VQRDQPLERIGQLRAVFGQPAREGITHRIVRVRQVIHARDHRRCPRLAIRDHAADADAAETDTVITAFAP
jgi:hypothetical protein